MSLHPLTQPEELDAHLGDKPVILGFFGSFSDTSNRALPAFQEFAAAHEATDVVLVDVGQVKGVHKRFGVQSVPTVVLVQDGEVSRKLVGPQSAAYYGRFLLDEPGLARRSASGEEAKPLKPVVVYTSDHCSWCTRAKDYLRRRSVRYREINVGRSPDEAKRLQAATGQTGVPQLNIGGQWVTGFDKKRIDSLLGLGPQDA